MIVKQAKLNAQTDHSCISPDSSLFGQDAQE